jgi:hypothetical protein
MVVICSHQSQNRLADLVAEHLDHLHYLNDILSLDIGDLNQVLTDHLLNKLLIPLYVYSLTKRRRHSQLEVMGSLSYLWVKATYKIFVQTDKFKKGTVSARVISAPAYFAHPNF